LGTIGAESLFAIAERVDHVPQLSRQIAERALAHAARWPGELRLSLNITASDLANGSFAEEMALVVRSSGFPAGRLTLEITEQVLLGDIDWAARCLEQLSGQGVRLALDDFGAGSGAAPLVTGTHPLLRELEVRLARFKGTDDAIVFGSGFVTIPQMVRAGIWLNLIGIAVIIGAVGFLIMKYL